MTLRLFPLSDRLVVTGGENVRDGKSFPHPRPRIVRMLEEAVFETFLACRFGLRHDARQEPYDRIEECHGSGLSARQHEIAERDFAQGSSLDDPFIHAFEAAADD